MPFRTIIVEDELHSREFLHNVLKEFCPQVEIVAQASTKDEAIGSIIRLDPDLVFLDIELRQGTGFDVLKEIPDPSFHIVFTTGADHQYIRAIQFSGLEFLLKPIDIDQLQKVIAHAIQLGAPVYNEKALCYLLNTVKKGETPEQLFLPGYNNADFVNVKDIVSIEAFDRECEVSLRGGQTRRTTRSIREVEALLWEMYFFRTHPGYIINLREMAGPIHSDSNFVQMTDGKLIPLSPKKREELREIQKHLSRSA